MNNDASPTSSARSPDQPLSGSNLNPDDTDLRDDEISRHRDDGLQERSASQTDRQRRKKNKKKRYPGLVKKLSFVTHLLKTLDLVVFAELSSLYYMECSMFRFIIRATTQYLYLTPKDETFPFLMTVTRIHVAVVLLPNILCIALHLFTAIPKGPEYHRGYQHGGLVVDFIGQKPAAYRFYYLLVDFIILFLQCFMLTIHTQRESLRLTLKTFRPLVPDILPDASAGRTAEDLDAEERGVSRHAPDITMDETEEIEMQSLSRPEDGGVLGGESGGTVTHETSNEEARRTQLSDLMSSGNAIIGSYHIIHSMRTAATDVERMTTNSLQTMGYRATLSAIAQRRGAAMHGRTLGSNR